MKNNLFISVMICCYNSEKYLREAIDSVIDQTYTNWEIVIVNDGSTDGTEEIILDYIDKGIPITYLKQENKIAVVTSKTSGVSCRRVIEVFGRIAKEAKPRSPILT